MKMQNKREERKGKEPAEAVWFCCHLRRRRRRRFLFRTLLFYHVKYVLPVSGCCVLRACPWWHPIQIPHPPCPCLLLLPVLRVARPFATQFWIIDYCQRTNNERHHITPHHTEINSFRARSPRRSSWRRRRRAWGSSRRSTARACGSCSPSCTG